MVIRSKVVVSFIKIERQNCRFYPSYRNKFSIILRKFRPGVILRIEYYEHPPHSRIKRQACARSPRILLRIFDTTRYLRCVFASSTRWSILCLCSLPVNLFLDFSVYKISKTVCLIYREQTLLWKITALIFLENRRSERAQITLAIAKFIIYTFFLFTGIESNAFRIIPLEFPPSLGNQKGRDPGGALIKVKAPLTSRKFSVTERNSKGSLPRLCKDFSFSLFFF